MNFTWHDQCFNQLPFVLFAAPLLLLLLSLLLWLAVRACCARLSSTSVRMQH